MEIIRQIATFYLSHFPVVVEILIACAMFVSRLPKRKLFPLRITLSLIVLFIVSAFWDGSVLSGIIWETLRYVLLFMLIIAGVIVSFKVRFSSALFCCVGAYAVQHIAYKLYVTVVYFTGYISSIPLFFVFYCAIRAAVYVLVYFTLIRRMKLNDNLKESNRYFILALSLLITCFVVIFNLYMLQNAEQYTAEAYILINIASIVVCVLSLVLLYCIFKDNKKSTEMEILQHMIYEEQEQYKQLKDTMDIINVKCHDIKHMLYGMNNIDVEERKKLEESISIYDSIAKTGNSALDIVLAEKSLLCQYKNIVFTYIADGASLNFMKESEIYSLFGNALDNAITAVEKLDEHERVIDMTVRATMGLVHIHFENPFKGTLELTGGLPQTTKDDTAFHGFGLKSISMIIKKYDGEIAISNENEVFRLDLSIPIK
jgi:hypothetical protein